MLSILLNLSLLINALPSHHSLPSAISPSPPLSYSHSHSHSQHPSLSIINTTSGPIAGFPSSPYPHITSYLGIPYAAPPVGALRFAPPQPFQQPPTSPPPNGDSTTPNSPSYHINALTPPKSCMQLTFTTLLNDKLSPIAAESEDCLTLNVWVPSAAPSSGSTSISSSTPTTKQAATNPLPVLIWLHGGGFAQGSSTPLDGISLLRNLAQEQSYIVVSVNYRLNVFGFPFLHSRPKNLGLRDQRAAVQWVRDNIAAFGGDGARLVLMGQSAGAMSVADWAFGQGEGEEETGMTGVRGVTGLVMWSGQPEGGLRDEGVGWRRAVGRLGCAGSGEEDWDEHEEEERILECLRGKDARAVKSAMSTSNFLRYDDYVDGWSAGSPSPDNETNFNVSNGEYVERGTQGRFVKVPVWIQHVLHDGDNLVSFDDRLPDAFVNGSGAINRTQADVTTLFAMHCPAWLHAGFRVMNGVPVWRSVYNGTFEALRPYRWMRAYHAEDVILAFRGDEAAAWGDVDDEMMRAGEYLRRAIAAFVHDPEEGLGEELGWVRYSGGGESLQVLFSEDEAKVGTINATEFDAPCREIWGGSFGGKDV